MRLVCISDTHMRHQNIIVPDGDILIHAGDMCGHGSLEELVQVIEWLKTLPHKHKIVIGGNHDRCIEQMHYITKNLFAEAGITLLYDSGREIEGIKFWGSPTTPEFNHWAFMKKRGEELARHWEQIPPGTDVLITHGPPLHILDFNNDVYCGDQDLLNAVKIIKPKFHIFGHIHGGHGTLEQDGTTFINATICTEEYNPTNKATIVEYEK